MNKIKLSAAFTKLAFLSSAGGEKAAQVLDEVAGGLRDDTRHTVPPHWDDRQKGTYTWIMDALEGEV